MISCFFDKHTFLFTRVLTFESILIRKQFIRVIDIKMKQLIHFVKPIKQG